MSRAGAPFKQGIDYFTIPVDDRILDSLEVEFGPIGPVIWIKLLKHIYKREGYYCLWNERELKSFVREFYIHYKDCALVESVVLFLFDEKHLDYLKYRDYQILTSGVIQKFFFFVTQRRKKVVYNPDHLCEGVAEYLIELKDSKKKKKDNDEKETDDSSTSKSDVNRNAINVNINSDNDDSKQPSVLSVALAELLGNQIDTDKINSEKVSEKTAKTGGEVNNVNINSENENKIPSNVSHNTTKESKAKQSEAKNLSLNFHTENITSKEVFEDVENKTIKNGQNKPSGKSKKKIHPARQEILNGWQVRFNLIYEQSLEDNQAINKIINSLEKNLKARGVEEDCLVNEVVNLWSALLKNWNLLKSDFYRDNIQFKSIAKNFDNILHDLLPKISKKSQKVKTVKNEEDFR